LRTKCPGPFNGIGPSLAKITRDNPLLSPKNLYFFSAGNVDLVVKVLNGCQFNNRFWVFAGGLTNVEYTVTVTDASTQASKTFTNPLG